MNYLLFNNDVYIADESQVQKMAKGIALKQRLELMDEAAICVVDVDIELASAPQAPIEKKDSMLARKFLKLHPQHDYVLSDEKIDDNIFQVTGIKTEKIREIYSLIPSSHLKSLVPYGIALRYFLQNRNIDLYKGLVFIDDCGDEKLLTVFSGAKFSVTRSLMPDDIDHIFPEIKRSQIGFSKKIEEFDNWKPDTIKVMTNARAIKDHPSGHGLNIEYLDVAFPFIEGLRAIHRLDRQVRFLLPEEIKKNKKRELLKKRAVSIILALIILGIGGGFASLNKVKLSILTSEYARLTRLNKILGTQLANLEIQTYREDLKQQKTLNYALAYLKILNVLPLSYEILTLRYYQTDHWHLEAFAYSKDKESFDEIPRVGLLKDAGISDYLIKDKPAKKIQVEL